MASSSSSTSSSSELWNYEVFLSFRGEDTRKTFVDHLYSALFQNGIHTYKDDESLPRGESIATALFKAIEESRIAVVVFSENYAKSSWCLTELAHIMKCKKDRRQIVVPIFYHVDPSDVRNQKRKYEEAFAEHESENSDRVDSWRKALEDAGNLSGWVTEDIENGHESKVIQQVVDEILDRLFPSEANDDEDLVGMRDRLQDLKSKLEIGSNDVRMVGIWGVGGGGKTTLASSVYREISSMFNGACFLENVREESCKRGLEKLQQKILKHVLKYKGEVNRVSEGRRLMRNRLRHKNVLIVVDDVDHLDQLKALVGSHDWFGRGSRIIITTRDEHLLKAHRVNVIYSVNLLDDVEARQLFRKHAFSEYISIEDYQRFSKKVISYAGGLPLALKVLGTFLCDKNKSEWVSALASLEDIPDKDVMKTLRISYDGLTHIQKSLFLDIACFFNGAIVKKPPFMLKNSDTTEILDACGFYPVIGMKVLMQKALISIDEYGAINVHDLLQELGHYIVRGEHPNNLEQHSRVRIQKSKEVRKFCDLLATTENYTLEALLINVVGIVEDIPHSLVMGAISNMKKLRWIEWNGFPASSLPVTFQPTELCWLNLQGSRLERLWEGCKYLPSLKVINLSGSSNLIKTPDLSGLPSLEKLLLQECHHLKQIHPSMGYHEGLVHVDMTGCAELEMFPPIVRMQKLETLILSKATRLCETSDLLKFETRHTYIFYRMASSS